MTRTIAIVIPVLDDWVSFEMLVAEISNLFSGSEFALRVYAVDDGSTVGSTPRLSYFPRPPAFSRSRLSALLPTSATNGPLRSACVRLPRAPR